MTSNPGKNGNGREVESLLIDLHLNRLDDDVLQDLEARIADDPELGALSDRIGRTLRPLDHWTAPPMPESLFERSISFIEHRGVRNDVAFTEPRSAQVSWRMRIPLREFIAVAACIVLLVGVMFPGIVHLRDTAHRARCASNLGSIFQGTRLYQTSFNGALPYAGNNAVSPWLPKQSADNYASNSRHMFLVAKHNFGPRTEHFICPSSSNGAPMTVDQLADRDDFARATNISFNSLNLSGDQPNLRPAGSIAYASDPNPLFRQFAFDGTIDPEHANSPAHRGRGQNVLMLDGSVRFLTSPVYGSRLDNIWLAGDIRHYDGTESPTRDDDSHLVPGYPVTDPAVRAMMASQ